MKIAPPPIRRASREPDTIAPDGSEIRLLATLAEGATRASLREVRLRPGAVSRPVAHRSVEEIWYVVEGHGQVSRCPPGTAADPVEVSPGDTLVCFTSLPWPGPDEARPAESGGLGEPTV